MKHKYLQSLKKEYENTIFIVMINPNNNRINLLLPTWRIDSGLSRIEIKKGDFHMKHSCPENKSGRKGA